MTPAVRFLLVIGVTAAVVVPCGMTWGSAVRGNERPPSSAPTKLSLIVEGRGRHSPSMTFDDPLDLSGEIIEGLEGLHPAPTQGIVAPLTPATADLDDDGQLDLLIKYATSAGEALTLRRASTPTVTSRGHKTEPLPARSDRHGNTRLRLAGPKRFASTARPALNAQPNILTVTTTSDSGEGSLRDALIRANMSTGPDTIVFAIPTSDPGFAEGVFTIRLLSPLPPLTGGGITIDGASQITVTGPTNGTHPVIKVTAADDGVASGFVLQSDNNTIRSLIISGFDVEEGAGIVITGDVSGNVVEGCLIGTTADGRAAEGNTIGVKVESGARNTTIGGTTAEARNVISGNGVGIALIGEATTGTRIVGNRIGQAVTGDPLGNRRAGILITDSSNNVIGGTSPGEGNVIAHQEGPGVEITGTAINNSILGNSIFDNGGLGIDLGGDGPTPNDEGDADTGPNNRQNFPVITDVAVRGTRVTIAGTLDTVAGDVRVEFFSDRACDPSGFAEGLQFLGAIMVTATGDPAQPARFSVELPAPVARFFVTATATDSAGNTSEFSSCQPSNTAPIADAGPDQRVDEGTVVTLDGTGSRDPDGDPITFEWRQVAGPPVTLSDPTSPRPTFTAPIVSPTVSPPVVLTFELVVSDGRLLSDPDQVQITVNRRPVANAGPDQTVDEGAVVTLDGTGSRDPDGDPITFEWRQTAGPPVTLSDPTSPRPRFTAPSLLLNEPTSLRLTFSLTVSDRRLNSAPDTVDITVQNVVRMDDSGRSGNQLKINLATNAFEFRIARTGQLFTGTITTIVRAAGDGGSVRMTGSGAGGARLEVTIDTRRGVGLAVLTVGRDAFVIFSPDMRRE
ncbi:MAG TPA: PKD domain-containing protein [Blastocatellia bacterium]|nr:PKD domain-containing protein [Blastocatellia bacterium]